MKLTCDLDDLMYEKEHHKYEGMTLVMEMKKEINCQTRTWQTPVMDEIWVQMKRYLLKMMWLTRNLYAHDLKEGFLGGLQQLIVD